MIEKLLRMCGGTGADASAPTQSQQPARTFRHESTSSGCFPTARLAAKFAAIFNPSGAESRSTTTEPPSAEEAKFAAPFNQPGDESYNTTTGPRSSERRVTRKPVPARFSLYRVPLTPLATFLKPDADLTDKEFGQFIANLADFLELDKIDAEAVNKHIACKIWPGPTAGRTEAIHGPDAGPTRNDSGFSLGSSSDTGSTGSAGAALKDGPFTPSQS